MKVKKSKSLFQSKPLHLLLVLITAIVLSQLVTEKVSQYFKEPKHEPRSNSAATLPIAIPLVEVAQETKETFWLHFGTADSSIFETLERVLTRLDLERNFESAPNTNWDLMWSYGHHSGVKLNWSELKYHQKVNHLPGNHFLGSKSVLGTTTNSKYVPKAFLKVEDVKDYVTKFPNKRFVVKKKSNRGVVLQNVTDMKFEPTQDNDDWFAMEFVENPLLFNGHKFDFAVYVVITSVNPLRLYYFNKNIIIRFCPKPYDTSDPEDRDRYVVRSSHIPGAKFPGIKEYFANNFTYKDGFNAFLESKGVSVEETWLKVEDLIRSIVLSKEKDLIENIARSGAMKYNFFEMYRFDLFLDNNLSLYTFEINQSPNIYGLGKYESDRHVYESVLYNLFNLIGVGTSYKTKNFRFPSLHEEEMVVHRNGLTVNPKTCLNFPCNETCSVKCELCWNCLSNNKRYDMKMAYLEQMNSGDMKRLFPPKKEFIETADDDFWNSLQPQSKLHAKWFQEMCKKSEKFC